MSKNHLILYHANCWDGFCAAWICHKVYPDAEFVPVQYVQYGQEPPDVRGRDVLIVDFSYPRSRLCAMKESAASLQVLDHHKTAQADLAGLDFCTFDTNASGAELVWRKFFPNDPLPGLVLYTKDRDLWLWNLPGSRAVNAALRTYPLDFDVWDRFGRLDSVGLVEFFLEQGEAILRSEAAIVEQHVKNAYEVEIDGHTVLCVNATVLISEIAGELAKDRPFGMCFWEGESERVYSMRSREGGIDVSEIAKAHGGGGHRNAAGFRVPATGATGLFTHGQVNADDEGQLQMAIAADRAAGIVRLDFGKPVAWLGLPKREAQALGSALMSKAGQL